MKRLKNRRQAPPNGFLYTQKETGWQNWKVDPSTVWDFFLCARAIQAHRQANPQFKLNTSLPAIEEELDMVNSARVGAIPGADIYLMEVGGAAPSFTVAPSTTLARLVSVAVGLKAGKEATDDWLDSGIPPVTPEVSARRAGICVKCPKNELGTLDRFFTIPLAAMIERRLEKLHKMELSTPLDKELGTCVACMCRNQLKVHEPLELVLKHTSAEVRAALDPRCWILHEETPPMKGAA